MSDADWPCPKCGRANGSWRVACHCCGYRAPRDPRKSPLDDYDPNALLLAGFVVPVCTAPGLIPMYVLMGINFNTQMPEPQNSLFTGIALGCAFGAFSCGILLARFILQRSRKRADPVPPTAQ